MNIFYARISLVEGRVRYNCVFIKSFLVKYELLFLIIGTGQIMEHNLKISLPLKTLWFDWFELESILSYLFQLF